MTGTDLGKEPTKPYGKTNFWKSIVSCSVLCPNVGSIFARPSFFCEHNTGSEHLAAPYLRSLRRVWGYLWQLFQIEKAKGGGGGGTMQNLEPGEFVCKEANKIGKHEVKVVNMLPTEKSLCFSTGCFACSSFPSLATSSPASH